MNTKLEVWGLILLLLSFGFQSFETTANRIASDNAEYNINKKLDNIFYIIADDYSDNHNTQNNMSANFDTISKNWTSYESQKK